MSKVKDKETIKNSKKKTPTSISENSDKTNSKFI